MKRMAPATGAGANQTPVKPGAKYLDSSALE
jgi:hypothetical protein